jgi:alpha-1,2-mannosyltransferase
MQAMEAVDPLTLTAADRWRLATRRALNHSLIVWPPLAIGWLLLVASEKDALAIDFHNAYLPAAHAVVAGHSPYPPATIAALFPRTAFIYPPLAAYLAAPFLLVPPVVADALVSALAIALVMAMLRLLGVRDWRCYAVVFLWISTYSAIQTGNVTMLLAFGLALLWRYRARAAVGAVVAGTLVALKLFTWPLLLWLVATRRQRAAAWALPVAAVLVVAPWAGIGFAGFTGYPHLLRVLTKAERGDGYTIAAVLSGTLGWQVAQLVGIAVGLAVLGLAIRVGRRDERNSFALAVASTLLLTPIVEIHYFIFLVVILAVCRPRFGVSWVLPLLLWIGPQGSNGATWQTAAVIAAVACVVVLATRPRPPVITAFAGKT